MKKRTKKEGTPALKDVKGSKKKAGNKSITGNPHDERTGFGILPDRDLKKNLGCG